MAWYLRTGSTKPSGIAVGSDGARDLVTSSVKGVRDAERIVAVGQGYDVAVAVGCLGIQDAPVGPRRMCNRPELSPTVRT